MKAVGNPGRVREGPHQASPELVEQRSVMKHGWVETTLGEIGKVSMCKRIFKEETTANGAIPFYKIGTFGNEPDAFIPVKTYNEYRSKYPFPKKGDVLISASGTIGRRVRYDGEPAYFQDSNIVWIANDEKQVLNDYLYHFYGACAWNSTKGATISRLYNDDLRRIRIALPPLAEQQRIVGLLDEAFEGLATAKANAEKNLQNARALFESHLHVEHAKKAMLGDLVNIKTGKLDANAAVEGGKYPFFTCSRDVFAIDTYAFDCEAILLAGNNAVGDFNVKHYNGKFNAYQRTYVITVNEKQRVLYRYLYFQMLKSLKKFKARSVGAGTKFLKLGMIKEMEIDLPSFEEQQRIVSRTDDMREETQRLARLYERKLDALEALKKSLLHQAFSGEL